MDLSWVLLKLDSETSPSLLPLRESVGRSQGLQALRQCREGVGLSTERGCGDDMEMVVYRSLDRNLVLDRNGVEWVWEWC